VTPATPAAASVRAGAAAMVIATVLWGATFVVARDLVRAVPPVELVTARFAVAAIVFGLAALLARPRAAASWRATLGGGVLSGALGGAGYLAQTIGLTSTRAGSSAFLTGVSAALAALLAWPLLGQRPTRPLAEGLALALAGSALLSLRPGAGGFALGAGEAWTLLCALAFALEIVALARWAPTRDPLRLATVRSATTALMLAPFAAGAPARLAALDGAGWARFAYLALAGSVVAGFLQILAQRVLSAGRAALLLALEPVFALVFALTLGGERFGPAWWAGAALILAGVARVEARPAT
jgi:drug/metabolite transporter (DMT)-like permease